MTSHCTSHYIYYLYETTAYQHTLAELRTISIRFFDQQFDLDLIRFRFFYDLHTSVDPTQFVCGRVGTAVLRSWPPTKLSPTAAVVVGLNKKDVEWANTDQTVWRCDTELKLPSWTARRHTLTLSIVLAPCGGCPLSDVRTSPTLVNRPTCLRAYNTQGCR